MSHLVKQQTIDSYIVFWIVLEQGEIFLPLLVAVRKEQEEQELEELASVGKLLKFDL